MDKSTAVRVLEEASEEAEGIEEDEEWKQDAAEESREEEEENLECGIGDENKAPIALGRYELAKQSKHK